MESNYDEAVIAKVVRETLGQVAGQARTPKMTLALAVALIEAVEQKASQMGVAAVVAVSDDKGRPVAVHCMDDAFVASYDIALNKTFTSAGLKMSTARLAQLAAPGKELYGIQHTNQGRIVIFGGGEPLFVHDRLIGAIGVSGGTAEQDTSLAAYGKSMLKEVISWN